MKLCTDLFTIPLASLLIFAIIIIVVHATCQKITLIFITINIPITTSVVIAITAAVVWLQCPLSRLKVGSQPKRRRKCKYIEIVKHCKLRRRMGLCSSVRYHRSSQQQRSPQLNLKSHSLKSDLHQRRAMKFSELAEHQRAKTLPAFPRSSASLRCGA